MNINLFLLIIAILWLCLLTGYAVWIYFVFKDLIKISKNKDFLNNTEEIKKIWTETKKINEKSKSNIQRVGLTKFNPFNESGGDHSFSLALLDGEKNGIIITSLHTRERTRMYVKEIFGGKSKSELSSEELESLRQCLDVK